VQGPKLKGGDPKTGMTEIMENVIVREKKQKTEEEKREKRKRVKQKKDGSADVGAEGGQR